MLSECVGLERGIYKTAQLRQLDGDPLGVGRIGYRPCCSRDRRNSLAICINSCGLPALP